MADGRRARGVGGASDDVSEGEIRSDSGEPKEDEEVQGKEMYSVALALMRLKCRNAAKVFGNWEENFDVLKRRLRQSLTNDSAINHT